MVREGDHRPRCGAAEFADLSDAELTDAASEVFASGTARETLVRYAALAREAAERTLGERAYDTRLVGLIRTPPGAHRPDGHR